MSGWKSTKDGKHFRTKSKPGISSDNSNNSSNHIGTQPSSLHQPIHQKHASLANNEDLTEAILKVWPQPENIEHTKIMAALKKEAKKQEAIDRESKRELTALVFINKVGRELNDKGIDFWNDPEDQQIKWLRVTNKNKTTKSVICMLKKINKKLEEDWEADN